MRDEMNDLDQAIAAHYEAFSAYPLKPKLDCCSHCELDRAEASLHARPLRELEWMDLGVYPFKAMTTFGDENDFKHFLPRILELYVVDPGHSRYDVSIVFAKLKYASWTSWPPSEKSAIQQFVSAWRRSLAARQSESTVAPWQIEELESALLESEFEAS